MTTTLDLDTLTLAHGAHHSRSAGVCLLEAVAWYAGESHSDMPACVSPVLRRYGIALNDRLTPERRQELKAFIPRLVGTADDGLDEQRRQLASRVLMTEWLPAWLRLAKLDDLAAQAEAGAGLQGAELSKALRAISDLTWKARTAARDRLAEQVKTELLKKWKTDPPVVAAVADAAAADAVAADVVAAVADAAAADAVAADVVAAVADAVAAVAAADAAVAADVVAAVAVAAAVADAVAVAAADVPYSAEWYQLRTKVYTAVRNALHKHYESSDTFAAVRALRDAQLDAGINLYDRMIQPA